MRWRMEIDDDVIAAARTPSVLGTPSDREGPLFGPRREHLSIAAVGAVLILSPSPRASANVLQQPSATKFWRRFRGSLSRWRCQRGP
jgi:hypothetical protein